MYAANPTRIANPAARFSTAACVAAALVATALTGLVAVGARTWLDQPFAGFFLRADRTIAAIGRAAWTDVATDRLFERTLVAVDGVAITESDAFYRHVAAQPVGSPIAYTVTDGTTMATVTVPSRRFSAADYWAVFGAYLATGLAFVLLAIVAAWTRPSGPLGPALLLLGGAAGLYMLTAADLYPPAGSLRLHAVATALLPATLLQFALAIGDTRSRFAHAVLPVVWAAALAAAISMQLAIGRPTEAPWVHATCDAALGCTLVAATVALASRVRATAERTTLLAGTALFGLGVPAVIFLLGGAVGGIPQNASATLAFLFPVTMSAALLRDDACLRGRHVAR